MVGGLLQLVAKGAQDIYLTGNPQITFFKIVYRRYTNFSIESILQTFKNEPVGEGNTSCTIARKGDLIHKIYIQQEIPTNANLKTITNYGYDYLKEVQLLIGSQVIDTHTNNWLETYAELTQPNEYGNFTSAHNALFMNSAPNIGMGHTTGNNVSHTATKFQSMTMAGGVDEYKFIPYFTSNTSNSVEDKSVSNNVKIPNKQQVTPYLGDDGLIEGYNGDNHDPPLYYTLKRDRPDLEKKRAVNDYAEYLYENEHHYIYTPLQFWFCRNIGLALPLIALQYDEVSVNISFKTFIADNISPELYVDYIFLDTDERRRFAQITHEYLIEQVQKLPDLSGESNRLTFNNQVKELIWVSGNGTKADYDKALIGRWRIQINGYDRFGSRDISYFTKQQINDYHTGYGGVTKRNSIAVYSFALNPEDHQPSGSINLSSINNFYLICEARGGEAVGDQIFTVYAVNYNVLRVMSGQAKLGYVN